jgi:hypothetical protein
MTCERALLTWPRAPLTGHGACPPLSHPIAAPNDESKKVGFSIFALTKSFKVDNLREVLSEEVAWPSGQASRQSAMSHHAVGGMNGTSTSAPSRIVSRRQSVDLGTSEKPSAGRVLVAIGEN